MAVVAVLVGNLILNSECTVEGGVLRGTMHYTGFPLGFFTKGRDSRGAMKELLIQFDSNSAA